MKSFKFSLVAPYVLLLPLFITKKYGEGWGGWTLGLVRVPHGCSLWQSIRAGWDTLQQFVSFEVGDVKGAAGQTWNMRFHKGFHDWKQPVLS
uniref:Uncharacterized protein n=1 Tax=Quercus lobata TaxID=97700 RepID=A0A7N2MD52_QUELO